MKQTISILAFFIIHSFLSAQDYCIKPFVLYPQLFHDVAVQKIFVDGKTWVDVIPKIAAKDLAIKYEQEKKSATFDLRQFVVDNFNMPPLPTESALEKGQQADIKNRLNALWKTLLRSGDKFENNATLLPLPNSYIVPGGRFREVYYWDSYFTMLGLKASKEYDKLEAMVKNFAYLINAYGFIPNGNRSYYLSRSQPPFFSLMVNLLASIKGDKVYIDYLPTMEREYAYWMDRTLPTKHVVWIDNKTILNKYDDRDSIPREESYAADVAIGQNFKGNVALLYKNLRTAAESGWDFSARWFADAAHIETIETTNILPVDLNCLLWNLENVIAKAALLAKDNNKSEMYAAVANRRKNAIQKVFYNDKSHWFTDYNLRTKSHTSVKCLAGLYPLFFNLAIESEIKNIAFVIRQDFLKPGGLLTTTFSSHQQWDAPNGWAPLQWMSIIGLENYNENALAQDIARRWTSLNHSVFQRTGKMFEKYNVVDMTLEAGGGEYPGQDGFGWTNGVFLALMEKYKF